MPRPTRGRRVRALVVLVVGTMLVAGCAPTPGGEGLPGRLVGIDDTGDGDEYALGGGWMVAARADRSADLWQVGGYDAAPTDLAHAQVTLAEDDLAAFDGVQARVTDAGRFRLDAPAGPGVICWLQQDESTGEMVGRGCGEIDVPEEGALRATWSEGGFSVGTA